MKVGRNDACPCGSGRKYKKCCIDLAGGAERAGILAAYAAAVDGRRSPHESVYSVVLRREQTLAQKGGVHAAVARELFLPARVAGLSVEECLAELRRLGFELDRERVLSEIDAGAEGAFEIAARLTEGSALDVNGRVLVGLTVHSLWKAQRPDRASHEMLEDLWDDAIELLAAEEYPKAVKTLLRLLLEIDARRVDTPQRVVPCGAPRDAIAYELLDALFALDDEGGPMTAARAKVLEGLIEDSTLDREELCEDLAETYQSLGRIDDVRRLYERFIEGGTSSPSMLAGLAEILETGDDADRARAATLLERLRAETPESAQILRRGRAAPEAPGAASLRPCRSSAEHRRLGRPATMPVLPSGP